MKNLTQKNLQSTSSKDFFNDREFDTKQLDPRALTPESETAKRFAAIFCSYGWQWIYKPVGFKAPWTTEAKYPLTPRDLWREHQSLNRFIGVRFGRETAYAMLDIDIDSPLHPYNNEHGLALIQEAMESIGLVRFVLVRSSHSKGLHLYFPLANPVNSFLLALAVGYALEQAGLTIKDGTLEIFPNRKRFDSEFQGHRIPLQPQSGSYLVDENLAPYSDSPESFLVQWEQAAAAQDMKQLQVALATSPRKKSYQTTSTTKKTFEEFDFDNSQRLLEGWTDKGQTQDMIFQIAIRHYVFDCIVDTQELAEAIANTARNSKGFYKYSSHVHQIDNLARDNARWIKEAKNKDGSDAYYPCNRRKNHKKKEQPVTDREKQPTALERIKLALEQIVDQSFSTVRSLFSKLTEIIKERFNVTPSTSTLEKYKELWQHLLTRCNTAYSNDYSDLDTDICTAQPKNSNLENAESITQSLVTPNPINEVLRGEILPSQKIIDPVISGTPAAPIFLEKSSEPIQANDFQPIMTPDQQLAIARTCPSPPMPESANRRSPKEPPRPNPSSLENIQAIVTADPSKAGSQLAMLQAKLFLPWLKSEERSQTEAAIAWLKKFLDSDRTRAIATDEHLQNC